MKTTAFHERNDATKPGLGSKTVTPSNTAPIWEGEYARSLHVLAAGDVHFLGADGVEDTWTVSAEMVPFVIPVAVSMVYSTGTSAATIKAIR